MVIPLMLRIGQKKGCNLKKVWELVGLMTLWLTIIDEWLGCEGVVLVVAVLLGCLVRMISACYLGIVVGAFIRKGEYVGVTWEI